MWNIGFFSLFAMLFVLMTNTPSMGFIQQVHWDYVVFLDLEGSSSDSNMSAALTNLREFALAVRVLGSYTRGSDRTVHVLPRFTATAISDLLCGSHG